MEGPLSSLMAWFFLKGLALGFVFAAPVGPVGLLCMRRSLSLGQRHGFLTGLGAATADAFYGAIAAFGITWISSWLLRYQSTLQIFGALVLSWIALSILKNKSSSSSLAVECSSELKSYLSTVLITMTHPAAIFSFLAAFAS